MEPGLVLLALGSAFCFALALVLTQLGLRSTAPLAGASISVPTTAALFLLLSPFTIEFGDWHAGGATLFVLAGLFFPAAVTLLTFASNRHLGPNLTGALGNLSPFFAVGLAVLLLGEVPRAMQLLGLLTVCGGVAVLVLDRSRIGAGWALLLPVGAALLRGLVQPVVKLGLQDWPSPFAAVTIGYLVSAGVILVARRIRRPAAGHGRDALWFLGVGLANGMAVLGLYAALARGPVAVVAPLVATYPLATLALNRLIRGDRSLSLAMMAGVGITVAGIALLLAG